MKKLLSLITALFIVLSLLVCTYTSAGALNYGEEWSSYTGTTAIKYIDVPQNYWAYDAIIRTSSKKWFGGYPDGSFMPEASITRAEALKVFVVFLGLELNDVTASSFYDVDTSEWYAPYIEAGKDLFPTHTTIQGKIPFNPDMPVTREDTIYALVKALGCNLGEKYVDQSVLNMFNDKSSISGSIQPYFSIALNHNLVSGYPDGTIRAQDPLSRAEFATLLLRGTEHGFHDKYEAKIQSVTITPPSPIELEVGDSVTLSARSVYTDGTSREYTDIMPYDASGNGVISLSGNNITALKEGTATIKYNGQYITNENTIITVKKPTFAPKIKITDYPDETSEANVEISGTISDESNDDIELTCNGKDVDVQSGGKFSANVRLDVGNNSIEFAAKNVYGNLTTKSISIKRIENANKQTEIINKAETDTGKDSAAVVMSTSYTNKDGAPMFDDFIGLAPSQHYDSNGKDTYKYDAWKYSGDDIFVPINSYISYLKRTGYKSSGEKEENSCMYYDFAKGDLNIQIVYDYLIGHIYIKISKK